MNRKNTLRGSAKNRPTTTPDNLENALMVNENQLIHIDPVPDFQEKIDVKVWLQEMFFPMGIDIVIERSDKTKIIFKCKPSDYRSHEPKDLRQKEPVDDKRHICPFRVRCTFSTQLKKWKIVIINNSHSHPLKFNPHSDEYAKFKRNLRDREMTETLKKFEELEYKAKSNLPMENLLSGNSIISCDCGLTKEIKTINNVYLPLNATQLQDEIDVSKILECQNKKQKNKQKVMKKRKSEKNELANIKKEEPSCSSALIHDKGFEITQDDLIQCGINDINDYDCDKYYTELLNKESYADASYCNIADFSNMNEIDFTGMFNKSKPAQRSLTKGDDLFSSIANDNFFSYEENIKDTTLVEPELLMAPVQDINENNIDDIFKMSTNTSSTPISPSTDPSTDIDQKIPDPLEFENVNYLDKYVDLSTVMINDPAKETYDSLFS